MKIYLVGGAVRDELLNLPIKDRDFVVVGSTFAEMEKLGFLQVGKDFPVFLHPQTHEEYALARTEKKIGKGHTNFKFDFNPQISLKEDLIRRDLTINAIAKADNGEFIDYFGGLEDLNNKVLRHISLAFSEDPLRVFRLMRFWARFFNLDFSIAPETLDLCREIVKSGELENLSVERIWQETVKALSEQNPEKYFEGLFMVGALDLILPLQNGWNEQRLKTLNNKLTEAVKKTQNPALRIALWANGDEIIINGLKKLKISREFIRYLELIKNTAEIFKSWQKQEPLNKWEVLKSADKYLLELLQALPINAEEFKKITADNEKIKKIKPEVLLKEGFSGLKLGEELKKRQICQLT